MRKIPDDQPWLVVVQGHAGVAAVDGAVAVEAWETGLLRIGAVINRLLAQGMPAERLATRFQAGFAGGGSPEMQAVEVKLVCCYR